MNAPLKSLLDQFFKCHAFGHGMHVAFEQAFDIFSENVDFEIHGITNSQLLQIRVRVSVRNNGEFGDAFEPARNGEADAVDSERAFFSDVATQILRHANSEPPVVTFRNHAFDATNAVDVALHKMPAEARSRGERQFQVDDAAGNGVGE